MEKLKSLIIKSLSTFDGVSEIRYIIAKRRADRRQKAIIDGFIRGVVSQEAFPLFQEIQIETINKCNSTCSFCPVNRNIDPRPYKRMEKELFHGIIKQLQNIDYSNAISLFSNNEPLLDTRIIEFCQFARQYLPDAFLYLYTNGSLLTVGKFVELMKYLDWLVIDNYNDQLILNEPVRKIHEYCQKNREYENKVRISIRRLNEVLNTRAGQAKNRRFKFSIKSSCVLPFAQIVVRPDGKVSLCCNDALGEMTLGDLAKDSLLNVWHSEEFTRIRRLIIEGRDKLPLCRQCDSLDYNGTEFLRDSPNFHYF